MTVWNHISDEQAGLLYNLSDSLRILENNYPNLLSPMTSGTMIIGSDYSGQHKEASHEAYSFIITTDIALQQWLPLLNAFRERWLPDNRRISYKKLNEKIRWKALPAYLETVSNLDGNLVTFLVDRKVGSFMHGGSEATIAAFPDCFEMDTPHGTVEKMLRIASFISLIVTGLRDERQPSEWISDHDEALDSYNKREQFARLAAYLTFGLAR